MIAICNLYVNVTFVVIQSFSENGAHDFLMFRFFASESKRDSMSISAMSL